MKTNNQNQEFILNEINKCVLNKIFNLVGKKWSMQILHSFKDKKIQSFNIILRNFRCIINHTLLSKRLAGFVECGILKKEDSKNYGLTHIGQMLLTCLHNFRDETIKQNFYIPEDCKNNNCICVSFIQDKQNKIFQKCKCS